MKQRILNAIRKRKGRILRAIRDRLGQVMLRLARPFAYALNRLVPGNQAYDSFSQHGYHLLRKHFYLPIPDETDLKDPLVNGPSELVGIDMNEAHALDFLQRVFPQYQEEFRRSFPLHVTDDPKQFYLVNGGFMAGYAHIYYALIRHVKPRRIIEVGGGNSSMLAAAACLRNLHEDGVKPHLTVVEPYPWELLKKGIPGMDVLLEERIQTVDLKLFTSLEAGDILFIDSSHVLRPGGDVHREYCEILPRLAPGVLVHIHDISLPKPYFQLYFQNHLYWNEQYLLQAFLAYNPRFEIIWPGTHLLTKYPEEMQHAFPEIQDMRKQYPLAEPSSFWLRVKDTMAQVRAA